MVRYKLVLLCIPQSYPPIMLMRPLFAYAWRGVVSFSAAV